MKCKGVQKLISGFMDSELQPAEREVFESHVKDCRICAERLHEMAEMKKMFSGAAKHEAPRYFAARVVAALREDKSRGFWSNFFFGEPVYLKMVEITLAILVVIIGAISGNLLTSEKDLQRPAEIRSFFSLDAFDPAPPASIGGVYLSILGGKP
jgi:anti-sigma factor RsiW